MAVQLAPGATAADLRGQLDSVGQPGLFSVDPLEAAVLSICEFHAGKLLSSAPTINLTNCLLERVYTEMQPTDGLTSYVRNCLVMGGTFNFGPTNSVIRDNLFDRCSITNWIQGRGNDYTGAYNAYVVNYPRLLKFSRSSPGRARPAHGCR